MTAALFQMATVDLQLPPKGRRPQHQRAVGPSDEKGPHRVQERPSPLALKLAIEQRLGVIFRLKPKLTEIPRPTWKGFVAGRETQVKQNRLLIIYEACCGIAPRDALR